MPRRKLRLELSEQEEVCLEAILRVHKAGGRKLTVDAARELVKHMHAVKLPGSKIRQQRNGGIQFKGLGFGRWREYSPLAYRNATAERDYWVMLEQAKLKRITGGAEARKAQGEQTRRCILEAWNQSTLPERSRATQVAKKLKVSPRQVRRVLRAK